MSDPRPKQPGTLDHRDGAALDRRRFLQALAGCGGALLLGRPTPARALAPAAGVLRIGLLLPESPPAAGSALLGAGMAAEEAGRVGGLLGWTVELQRVEPGTPGMPERPDGVHALLAGWEAADCEWLGTLAPSSTVPVLNVGCADDALRGPRCGRLLFHVAASDAMRADALRLHDGEAPPAGTRVALWHPALERFGAAQLNDRFRARFRREMDEAAWAGWVAVKLLWEAALRSGTAEPAALAAYLAGERAQFDGHKGWPLSFRPWDRQLRQPLYLVAGEGAGRVVGEVPVRSAGGAGSSREQLDRLGATRSTTTCQHLAEAGR